jgi:peptidyl-tRNA hydrolase, PTH1 family
MHLVVGLGNPGGRYARTRHNVGFMAVDHLASRAGVAVEKKLFGALVADVQLSSRKVLLTKPQSFMNLSGQPVASLMGFYKVPAADLIVIHDEMDLPLGRIKVQQGRGSGGHNGIRDVQRVAGNDYVRVRLGVGRPPPQWDPAEYVLSAFSAEEEQVVSTMLSTAADAVECAVADGVVVAMNRFNGEKPPARASSGD